MSKTAKATGGTPTGAKGAAPQKKNTLVSAIHKLRRAKDPLAYAMPQPAPVKKK